LSDAIADMSSWVDPTAKATLGAEVFGLLHLTSALHAARLNGKRLLALWNGLPGVDRLSKVGNREALLDRLWSVLEALPDPELPRASKQAEVIALLRRPEGVTVDEVRAVTGWQPHTVRGVFSGALKKKLGLAIVAGKEERGRVYRIAEARA